MPGDYSRKIFDRKKHYSAVLEQQGRVQVDADWNEQVDIQQYHKQIVAVDVIGKSGVPKKNGGFNITANENNTNLRISPGRLYAGGLLFECEEGSNASYLQQPHMPEPDTSMFAGELRLLAEGTYMAYLDGWQREVTYLDDPQIQEVALGEADTTTRLQNAWQVKLARIAANGIVDCKTDLQEWNTIVTAPTGRLNVQTADNVAETKPCVLPAGGGYSSLENQLYRIQIMRGGTQANATYMWSRDNGSVETAIVTVSGSTLTVSDLGKDDILGFAGGNWVEIVEAEPSAMTPVLFQIDAIKPELKQIELKSSAIAFQGKTKLKLRRWDVQGNSMEAGIPVATSWANLENGIQVQFSAGTYKAGDYWLVPARTATADIEWPRDSVNNSIAQLPRGTAHYFCKLALIRVVNGVVTINDCRPRFPALTEICAEDICYTNKGCAESTATNVQEALDELCHKRDGACTYIAFPGVGWEKVFEKIEKGKDAQICFQVGDYPLTNLALIKEKGHLKLNGAGAGTRILATGTEAALIFEQCKSVTIRDMYVATASFLQHPSKVTRHLNGVITCIDALSVKIADVVVQCGAASKKQATCITVRNNSQIKSNVTIQGCDLNIGHYQQGILLVNVTNAIVQDNRLQSHGSFNSVSKTILLSDKKYLANTRLSLITKAGVKGLTATAGMSVVSLSAAGQSIQFLTPNTLKNDWQRLLVQNPGRNIFSANDLLSHVKKLADKVMLDKNFAESIASFRAMRRAIFLQTDAIASRGITIGGTLASSVRIVNNNISNAMVGVHIGLSHQAARNVHDKAGTVSIAGNHIGISLPRDAGKLERHGIFVGNCGSLMIENNIISLSRLSGAAATSITGIKVWGVLGSRLMVTQNVVCSKDEVRNNSFSTGISITPIVKKTILQQWVVTYNVAPSKSNTVVVTNGVMVNNNTP